MRWPTLCLVLALTLYAAPMLADEAVPFAGFAGLILGNPTPDPANVPNKNYVALYSLAEHGGPTRIGGMCEIEGLDGEQVTQFPDGSVQVTVTVVREGGATEKLARFRVRMRDGEGETSRIREFDVMPGDFLLFRFKTRSRLQLAPGEQVIFTGYAGAPDEF